MKNLENLNEDEFRTIIEQALDNLYMDMDDVNKEVVFDRVYDKAYYEGKYYPQTQWEPAEYPELIVDYDIYLEDVVELIWNNISEDRDEIDKNQLTHMLDLYGYLLDEEKVTEMIDERKAWNNDYYED